MAEQNYIIGIDPGDSTGVAVLECFDSEAPTVFYQTTVIGGVREFIEWWRNRELVFVHGRVDYLVCEKFIVRPGFVGDVEALKIEGVLAVFRPDTVYQMPSMKQNILPNKTEAERFAYLRELGYTANSSHEYDAITHCLVFLRSQGHKPTLEMLRKGKTPTS